MKVRNIVVVKGSCPMAKDIEEKKQSLIPLPSSRRLENFDHFFPSKDPTLGKMEPPSHITTL
jgi:hypothetical protein